MLSFIRVALVIVSFHSNRIVTETESIFKPGLLTMPIYYRENEYIQNVLPSHNISFLTDLQKLSFLVFSSMEIEISTSQKGEKSKMMWE